jgi:hypothetical protein
MLVTKSGSGNKFHRLDFLGDFHSCPLPEIVPDNNLHTWYLISLYRFSNAKITSDVLAAFLKDGRGENNKGQSHTFFKIDFCTQFTSTPSEEPTVKVVR